MSLALSLALSLSFGPVAPQPMASTEMGLPRVRYFKEVVPSSLSTSRFLVQTDDGGPPRLPAGGVFRLDPAGPAAPGFTAIVTDRPNDAPEALAALRTDPRTLLVSPLVESPGGDWRAPTSRIVVRFVDGVAEERIATELAAIGEVRQRRFAGMSNAYLVETHLREGVEVLRRADALTDLAIVRFAEPEYLLRGEPLEIPNDPKFDALWGWHNTGQAPVPCSSGGGTANVDMNGPEGWLLGTGDPSVIVVVIDNGVQFDHPDLLALPAIEFDITGQNGQGWPVVPCDNHGTSVAGCIAALRDNGLGICGLASGVTIASARISTVAPACSPWTVNSLWVAGALDWSVSIGARITNTSWYFTNSAVIADAYAVTEEAGLLHIAAAGNFTSSQVSFPASLPSVVAVGAITKSGAKADFSNWGVDLEFVGPGSQILCLDRTGTAGYGSDDYTCLQGTSFASPAVAGIAAQMLSINPTLSGRQLRTLMKTVTTDLGATGWDSTFGWGLPRADAAALVAANPADLDHDGQLDAEDLAMLLGLWGSSGPLGDITGDGSVGAEDLALLLGAWELP